MYMVQHAGVLWNVFYDPAYSSQSQMIGVYAMWPGIKSFLIITIVAPAGPMFLEAPAYTTPTRSQLTRLVAMLEDMSTTMVMSLGTSS